MGRWLGRWYTSPKAFGLGQADFPTQTVFARIPRERPPAREGGKDLGEVWVGQKILVVWAGQNMALGLCLTILAFIQ